MPYARHTPDNELRRTLLVLLLRATMQQDESELQDHELIAAVEAYENTAFDVESREMSVLTSASPPTPNC